MTIKDFLKRKPIHPRIRSKTKVDKEKEVEGEGRFPDDPLSWCDADNDLLEDPDINIIIDDDGEMVDNVFVDGKKVENLKTIDEMEEELIKLKKKFTMMEFPHITGK